MSTGSIRLAVLLLVVASGWYLPWLLTSLNTAALPLAVPFFLANVIVIVSPLLAGLNSWTRSRPVSRMVLPGAEPVVAVIVPTCGEPLGMVERTMRSVLEQRWPHDRLVLVLSDDRGRLEMAALVRELGREFTHAEMRYVTPPPHGSPQRRGDAKAGNLNYVLDVLDAEGGLGLLPLCEYVETRDADDEVGNLDFLRETVGLLIADERVGYVQTVKEAQVGSGDPFGNRDPLFYRGSMLGRHAGGAAFPCGSGLVWRRRALDDIGGFPVWNLVEDLQSGLEALRRGWRGIYHPIVGAIAQHAPEDVAGVYKQRGTWALDTVRLAIWADHSGLTLRQRLHFAELPLFYLQGPALLLFFLCPVIGFLSSTYPTTTTQAAYAVHFWPMAIALELCLVSLNKGNAYEVLWRARQMWVGLAPVYAKACVLALFNGPHRKPVYRVTRKIDIVAWYWRQTLVQWVLVVALVGSAIWASSQQSLLRQVDLGSLYWGAFLTVCMLGFLRGSWYRVDVRGIVRARLVTGLARLRVLTIDHGRVVSHLGEAAASLDLSVVVTSRHEGANLNALCERLATVLEPTSLSWELIVVDDADERREVTRPPAALGWHTLRRGPEERGDGRSGATLAGFRRAHGRCLVALDADMQHPPEALLSVLRPVFVGESQVSVALSWSATSSWSSRVARRIVHRAFRRSRGMTDPLSCYFAVERSVVARADLSPTARTLLLELLVQGRWSHASEVPLAFERAGAHAHARGGSNALSAALRLLRGLVRLRMRSLLVVGAPPTRHEVPATRQVPEAMGPASRAELTRGAVAS